MTLKALIFDVDGTLADTERDGHRPAFNQAFALAGLDWYWGEALYGELLTVTGGKERIKYYVERYLPAAQQPKNLNQLAIDLHKVKTQCFVDIVSKGGLPLRTGVRRVLEAARAQGLRLAIATTTTPANVTALLQHSLGAGSAAWFDVIAAGDIVPAKKPAPDIYLWALQTLGLSAAECVAFEGSNNGLSASLGAGILTIVTVNDYTQHEDFTGAWLVLSDLGDVDAPCQVLQGNMQGKQMLGLDWLY